jgi:predicted short-subunit dehydrogenase-like oxidoreductase (DUF2520 family)
MRYLHMKKNTGLEMLVKKSTALFIATPDDAIPEACQSIKAHISGRTYVFHFSGALPSTIIPKQKGMYRAAVHPFATFPRLIIPPRRARIPLYIEGDTPAKNAAKRIFQGRMFSTRIIPQSRKIYCHLTGVFASNFVIALLMDTLNIMKLAGIPSRDLKDSVLPIVNDTLSNINTLGVHHALSGPLQRGDTATIIKHLKALRSDPLLLRTYRILSLAILKTLPTTRQTKELQKILNSTL